MEEQKKNTSKIRWIVYLAAVVVIGILVYRVVIVPKGGDGHRHSHSDAVADDNVEYTIEQIIAKRRGWDPIMTEIYGKTAPDFTVKTLDKCIDECTANGGKIIAEAKDMGNYGRYCVIEDPAGAVCALFEPA